MSSFAGNESDSRYIDCDSFRGPNSLGSVPSNPYFLSEHHIAQLIMKVRTTRGLRKRNGKMMERYEASGAAYLTNNASLVKSRAISGAILRDDRLTTSSPASMK